MKKTAIVFVVVLAVLSTSYYYRGIFSLVFNRWEYSSPVEFNNARIYFDDDCYIINDDDMLLVYSLNIGPSACLYIDEYKGDSVDNLEGSLSNSTDFELVRVERIQYKGFSASQFTLIDRVPSKIEILTVVPARRFIISYHGPERYYSYFKTIIETVEFLSE